MCTRWSRSSRTAYKFGHFSDWAGHFNAANGQGKIEIYENVNGKRGTLLASASRFLPPGPVLIAIKGAWPPKSDTPTALGSIEAIANSCVLQFVCFRVEMLPLPAVASRWLFVVVAATVTASRTDSV